MAIQFQPLSAGSGVVKIERKGTGGQAVPNSGLVEKLVFNTELTPTEVDNIITNANLDFISLSSDEPPMYIVFGNIDNEALLVIGDYGALIGDGTIAYMIAAIMGGESLTLYVSSALKDLVGNEGWNTDIFSQLGSNEFPLNIEAQSEMEGMTFGQQNDAIIDLINAGGIKPYLKELKGTYEPVDVNVTENTTIDLVTQYMDNKQMPVSVNVNVPKPTPNLQEKTATPSTSSQTITFDDGYDGLKQVTISGVTSSIDSDIVVSNIKKGVNILGVTGIYEGENFNIENSNIIEISDYAYENFDIVNVTMNNVTKVGNYAFKNNKKLFYVELNNAISIGDYSFSGCTSLNMTNLQNIKSIGNNAFDGCILLNGIVDIVYSSSSIPTLEEIGDYAFNGCDILGTLDLPNLRIIGSQAFVLNENLQIVNIPNATTIGRQCFGNCKNLTNITLSNSLTYVPELFIASCSALTTLDLPSSIEGIHGGAFGRSGLTTLVIRNTTKVVELQAVGEVMVGSWFYDTPLGNGTGYIYVPDELVESYKADTNWQSALPNYSTQIKPLSEYVEA